MENKKIQGFASKAQMERCAQMVKDKTMTQEAFDAYLAATDMHTLPERKHPKKDK